MNTQLNVKSSCGVPNINEIQKQAKSVKRSWRSHTVCVNNKPISVRNYILLFATSRGITLPIKNPCYQPNDSCDETIFENSSRFERLMIKAGFKQNKSLKTRDVRQITKITSSFVKKENAKALEAFIQDKGEAPTWSSLKASLPNLKGKFKQSFIKNDPDYSGGRLLTREDFQEEQKVFLKKWEESILIQDHPKESIFNLTINKIKERCIRINKNINRIYKSLRSSKKEVPPKIQVEKKPNEKKPNGKKPSYNLNDTVVEDWDTIAEINIFSQTLSLHFPSLSENKKLSTKCAKELGNIQIDPSDEDSTPLELLNNFLPKLHIQMAMPISHLSWNTFKKEINELQGQLKKITTVSTPEAKKAVLAMSADLSNLKANIDEAQKPEMIQVSNQKTKEEAIAMSLDLEEVETKIDMAQKKLGNSNNNKKNGAILDLNEAKKEIKEARKIILNISKISNPITKHKELTEKYFPKTMEAIIKNIPLKIQQYQSSHLPPWELLSELDEEPKNQEILKPEKRPIQKKPNLFILQKTAQRQLEPKEIEKNIRGYETRLKLRYNKLKAEKENETEYNETLKIMEASLEDFNQILKTLSSNRGGK